MARMGIWRQVSLLPGLAVAGRMAARAWSAASGERRRVVSRPARRNLRNGRSAPSLWANTRTARVRLSPSRYRWSRAALHLELAQGSPELLGRDFWREFGGVEGGWKSGFRETVRGLRPFGQMRQLVVSGCPHGPGRCWASGAAAAGYFFRRRSRIGKSPLPSKMSLRESS